MDRLRHYLSAAKEYAKDYILENTGLKVLALLITAVLWLSVASRPVRRVTMQNVSIIFSHISPDLIISKYETLVARVDLEGPRDVLESLRPSEVIVVADMTGIEPGVRVRPLTLDASRLPASLKGEVDPRSVRITVERVVEKNLPIIPRFDGHPAPGYEVLGWQITPKEHASVHVRGAESQMRDITEVSTETVRLSDKAQTFSESVAIDIGLPNLYIRDGDPRQVMLTVSVGEVRKERTVEHVPISLINAPPGAAAIPKYVSVKLIGARSAIDELTAADINVAVDFQAGGNTGRMFAPKVTVSPNYSDRVTVREVEPANVRVK
jgi:YbbR domain-containing protein